MLKLNKKRTITKKQVMKLFGSVQKAADWFGIDRIAVHSWPQKGPIPELRELQIREAQLREELKSLKEKLRMYE